jgi:Rieske Fe-S protein
MNLMADAPPVSKLQAMAIEEVLEHVNIPSYLLDAQGVIRWVNPAAKRIVGAVEGRLFTSVVAPEETRRARELFARKVIGNASVTDAGVVLEKGCVYIVRLQERLKLPKGLIARANPKSSTGRVDVFVRLLTDQGARFDDVAEGYDGPLYMEVAPQTFSILVRPGTRLNQLIVVRLSPDALSDETRARAADGVVAYSGVCTHTGCDVTDWLAPVRHFKCPCHESEYDPGDAARVVSGPAPWQLAALPLQIAGGVLAVAGPFVGKVGFEQPGSPSGE